MLGGCATNTQTGAASGSAIGATLGAIIGAAVGGKQGALIGAGIGALAGAGVGGVIGNRLDARDRERREAVLQETLKTAPMNQSVPWVNPDTGNAGAIMAGSAYTSPTSQRQCREFEETYVRQGTTYAQKSRACLGPDGTWLMDSL
jgi:surface antigen